MVTDDVSHCKEACDCLTSCAHWTERIGALHGFAYLLHQVAVNIEEAHRPAPLSSISTVSQWRGTSAHQMARRRRYDPTQELVRGGWLSTMPQTAVGCEAGFPIRGIRCC